MIPVIAIDGPAASGKSSTGQSVARQLGWNHLDTGSLYRGLTLVALELGMPPDAREILAGAEGRGLGLARDDHELRVILDGHPAESRLRSSDIASAVSRVSAMPELRDWATARFRDAVRRSGATVLDGRDIATAVFPDAPLKVYLTASPEARAERRLLQWGRPATPSAIADEAARLAARDEADSTRAVAPLSRHPEAILVDTTHLTPAEQVDRIVALARKIWLP